MGQCYTSCAKGDRNNHQYSHRNTKDRTFIPERRTNQNNMETILSNSVVDLQYQS